MAYFVRYMDIISRGGYLVGSIVLAPVMLLLSLNIIVRAFGVVIPGTYSLVVLMSIFITCPAVLHAQISKRQITLDILANKLGPKIKIVNVWITGILELAIWGFAAWADLHYSWVMWLRNELQDPLNIPLAPFRFILGITLILICFATIANLIRPFITATAKEEGETWTPS